MEYKKRRLKDPENKIKLQLDIISWSFLIYELIEQNRGRKVKLL